MTNEEIALIDSLTIEEIKTLILILNKEPEEQIKIINYLTSKLIRNEKVIDAMTLSTEIPVKYIPILGINYPWNLRSGSVADILNTSDQEKMKGGILGPIKVANLNYATDFLINHLNEKIKISREKNIPILTGQEILDEDLSKKILLIEKSFSEINNFLLENGTDYVFSSTKTHPNLNQLSDKMRHNLIEILARFSYVEDLESNNIESFKKFIKK